MSLDKSENKVQIHHLQQKRFYMVKRLWKSVQYIRRYSTKYGRFFWPCHTRHSQMSSVNSGSYWTKVHKIFTQYRGIIYAVNAHIEVAISHSISKCQSDEREEFAIFSQNWLPICDIGKRSADWSSAPKKTLSFNEKIVKISQVDPKIICSPTNH